MFNIKLVKYLKEYIIKQNDNIIELKKLLKEHGYDKPIYFPSDRSEIITGLFPNSALIKFENFINTLKIEENKKYTSIIIEEKKYDVHISFVNMPEDVLKKHEITESMANNLSTQLQLKDNLFIRIYDINDNVYIYSKSLISNIEIIKNGKK